jgi:HD-GYP domain-containing protein (c-di-GMP phosphodiesterase class II)
MPARKTQRVSKSVAKPKASKSPKTPKSTEEKKLGISQALNRIQGLESEMTQVIRDMQEKVQQLECLNDFSRIMNSSLDTRVVREKALEATCQLLGCEAASLLLVDRAHGELYWEIAIGEEEGVETKRGVRLSIDDQSFAGYVAMTGESLLINNVTKDSLSSNRTQDQLSPSIQTLLCVPLKSKDKIIGVLQAMNKLVSAPPRSSQHKWPDFYENDRRLLETLGHQVAIAIENSQLYSEIKKNFFETVEALAEAIEKKDHYTGGHTKRVVYYAMCIAKYLNLGPEELERVRLGAILHDVGKIGIEDKILKKQAPLDPEEWKVMQKHPELGYDIMRRVEGLKDVIGGMRYHHERWDGKGYPLGLKGEEIPLLARIISVADTYDAMVSTRPYRKGIDPLRAYDEIVRYRGTQFDPEVVDAFMKAFQREKMGKGSGGSSHGDSESYRLANCD